MSYTKYIAWLLRRKK